MTVPGTPGRHLSRRERAHGCGSAIGALLPERDDCTRPDTLDVTAVAAGRGPVQRATRGSDDS